MVRFFLTLVACALIFAGAAPEGMAQQGAASSAAPFSVAPKTTTQEDADAPKYALLGDGSPDYDVWNKLAKRVEQALQVGRASDTVMRDLRADLTDWRALFVTAQRENSVRINTLKTQIATLGPKPQGDGDEPVFLTQRRNELTRELNAAEVPVQTAEEAFARVNVLIREVDTMLRGRQAEALWKISPSPINPTLWPEAVDDFVTTFRQAVRELRSNWGKDAQWQRLQENLPAVLILFVIGSVFLLRGRSWVLRFHTYLCRKRTGPQLGVISFVVSLGQLIFPFIGILLLMLSVYLTDVLGLRSQIIFNAIPDILMTVFVSMWINNRIFGSGGMSWTIIEFKSERANAEARWTTMLLGVVMAVWVLLVEINQYEKYSTPTWAVLSFALFVPMGFLLFRFARLLRHYIRADDGEERGGVFRSNMLRALAFVTSFVAIAGPLAATVGYATLASALLIPWVLTLGLVAFLDILHRLITNLYGVILGKSETEARQALWPILISFMVSLLALPVLALIWGARTTDLTELWTTVMSGIQLGNARLTPRTFLIFALVFVIGYTATRFLQNMLKSSILPKTKLDIGGQNAISAGVGYVGIFLAALVAITSAGLDLSSVAIVAGALSVGIGFGLQNIVSNFVSGIILLIERPISEGDWIEVGGRMGYVRDISVRSTRIETFDRSDVILPNSDLISGVVTNYTRGNAIGRIILPVGVAYGTDTKRVEEVLREIAEAHPMVTVNPPPSVLFQNFGADALEFEIRAILSDVNFSLSVKSEMNHEIARRFAEEGFEIPFAQRDLWLRNPEVLQPASAAGQAGQAGGAMQSQLNATPDAFTAEDMQTSTDEGVEGEGDE